MQHARKMVLVPAERYMHNEQSVVHQTQPTKIMDSVQTPGDKISRLDHEMSSILNSTLPDDEKWRSYEQVLRRYLFNVQKPTVSAQEEKSPLDSSDTLTQPLESIISSVPSKFKNKAKMFMEFLTSGAGRGRISWDNKGVISIDDQPIENSNIVDILNDVMRPRKNFHAEGKHKVAAVLKDLSVPQEFIGNEFYNRLKTQNLPTSTPKNLHKTFYTSANESSISNAFEESTGSQSKNKSKNQSGRGWVRIQM